MSSAAGHPLSHDREHRLNSLGYQLPEAPPPAAIYLPFMRTGDQLWVAGQIALKGGALIASGRVGAEVNIETASLCAQQCALNLLAQVKASTGSIDQIVRVVKLNVLLPLPQTLRHSISSPMELQSYLVKYLALKVLTLDQQWESLVYRSIARWRSTRSLRYAELFEGC